MDMGRHDLYLLLMRIKPKLGIGFFVFFCTFTILIPTQGAAATHTNLDTIRDTVRQFIVTSLGGANPDTKIIVKPLDPRLRLSKCEQELSVYLAPGTRLRGHSTVGIRCDGNTPWALFVPVHVEQLVPVITANASIRRGQVLDGENLHISKRSSSSLPGNYLKTSDAIIGQIATREIVAGTLLTQSMFKPQKIVKRGQRVTLSMKTGAIAIRVAGIAMTDGIRGERIKVRNLSSKKIIDGTVSDANVVLVGGAALR